MKKRLFVSYLLSLAFICPGLFTFAAPIIWTPPVIYIKALETCSGLDYTERKNNMVYNYKIRGLNSKNKCEVELSGHEDYEKKEVYDDIVKFVKAFGGENIKESDIPTPEEMTESAKKENLPMLCAFSKRQRVLLYKAYKKDLKKDNSKKQSLYEKLMTAYYPETCNYPNPE